MLSISADSHFCRCHKPCSSFQTAVGLDVLCIIGCALHWAPHLLKSTEKQQDPSDSFILGRTPRMDSMTFGMYFSSGSPSVLRNKDDQGEELRSMCSTFNKCHRFYLQSSILQNDLTFQWKKHFQEKITKFCFDPIVNLRSLRAKNQLLNISLAHHHL